MDSKPCQQVNNFLGKKKNTATEYVDYKKHPDFRNIQTQGECVLEERKNSFTVTVQVMSDLFIYTFFWNMDLLQRV